MGVSGMSRAAIFFLTVVGLFGFSPAAQAEDGKPVDEKLLTKEQSQAFVQRRDESLLAAFDQFPLIEIPPRGAEKPKIHTIEMNRNPVVIDGWRYDGFRFRVERGKDPALQKNLSFVWGLVGFPELKSWYILPKVGKMKGFTHFMNERKSKLRRIRDAAGPQNVPFYSQPLSPSSLEEGGEYLIHIRFKDDQPKNVTFVATFADLSDPQTGDLLGALGCEMIKDE
jgi:hypothetical protein